MFISLSSSDTLFKFVSLACFSHAIKFGDCAV